MRFLLVVLVVVAWLWLCFEFLGWVASTFGLGAAIVVGVLMFSFRAKR